MKCLCAVFSSFLLVLSVSMPAQAAKHVLDLEGAWVWPGYNDVCIPGDSGTRFSLTDDLESDSFGAFRARYTVTVSGRHDIGLLAAFLTSVSDGTRTETTDFNGTSFPAGTGLDASFRFNSYRLSYRYLFYESPKLQLRAGMSMKVRDAAIRLSGGGLESEKTDLGLVPLISFSGVWKVHPWISLSIDGDALAAPQGRAEDVLFAVSMPVNDNISVKAGYRILEGGADNDKVYTFSLFHYAVAGITVNF